MTLGFALVAALLFLAWLPDRRALLWAAFVLGLGFASGLSLSGHSAADAGASWLSELADWVHLSAARSGSAGSCRSRSSSGRPRRAPARAFLRFSRWRRC